MKTALLAAGLRKIRPHDLRHTYAALALLTGVVLLSVSRQLRHAPIAITADIYAHAVPGGNWVAAEALEAILTRNQAQPQHLTARQRSPFVNRELHKALSNRTSVDLFALPVVLLFSDGRVTFPMYGWRDASSLPVFALDIV